METFDYVIIYFHNCYYNSLILYNICNIYLLLQQYYTLL